MPLYDDYDTEDGFASVSLDPEFTSPSRTDPWDADEFEEVCRAPLRCI